MPILTATVTAQILAVTIFGALMPIIVAAQTPPPNGNDIYAVLGSCFATLICVLQCLESRRGYHYIMLVVSSTVIVGSLAPGFTTWLLSDFFLSQEKVDKINWQTWAFAGFFYGLGGVAVVHQIINKWPKLLDRGYNYVLKEKENKA